jgi:nitrogen PTS system EIIA component
MSISDLLGLADIHMDVDLTSKKEVLQFLSDRVSEKCGLRAGECRNALASRERLGSTTIGSGVAFPHAQLDNLPAPFAILLRLASPVDYSGSGDEPVDLVVMLLAPTGGTREHLEGLSTFARSLRSPDTLRHIRSARTEAEVLAALSQ